MSHMKGKWTFFRELFYDLIGRKELVPLSYWQEALYEDILIVTCDQECMNLLAGRFYIEKSNFQSIAINYESAAMLL